MFFSRILALLNTQLGKGESFMKRIIIAAIVLVSLTATLSFAEGLKLGVAALTSINNFSSGDSDMDKDLGVGMGFGGGLAIGIPLGSQLSFNPGVNFLYRKLFSYDKNSVEQYVSELALSVPVVVQFRPVSDVGAYVSAGVQADLPFSSEMTMKAGGQEQSTKIDKRSTIDFGLSFGAGYMINENIGVDARFTLGLTHLTSESGDDSSLQQYTASVIYFF
jgi:opacity protein-like surface antigen